MSPRPKRKPSARKLKIKVMKNLAFALILFLIFCFAALAQTNETSPCPMISITGPSDIISPNEPIIFAAHFSKKAEDFNLKYNWIVSSGEIIEGQGTLIVKVLQNDISKNLTATVEIKGLPKECESIASVTMSVDLARKPELFAEFSTASLQIDKARLDSLTKKLLDEPTATIYIIEKFKPNTSQKSIKQKVQKIKDYLIKEKGIEKDIIVILTALSDKNLSQFFIVPIGSSPPTINDK